MVPMIPPCPPMLARLFQAVSASFGLGLAPAGAMTLLVGSTDLEPGRVTAVADASGRLMASGTGFVAVGAFGDLDDASIRAAGTTGQGLEDVLGQFQQLGKTSRFGLGEGLERIDGAFQAAISAPTRDGDGLVGRPVYVLGGDERGLFIFKSRLTFEADAPLAWGQVDMWGDREAVEAGLLVGSVGESLEVLELGSAEFSVRLAPAPGDGLDLARFEASLPSPQTPDDPPDGAAESTALEPPGSDSSPTPEAPSLVPPPAKVAEEKPPTPPSPVEPPRIEWIPWRENGWISGDGRWSWQRMVMEPSGTYVPDSAMGGLEGISSFSLATGGLDAAGTTFTLVPEPASTLLVAASTLLLGRRRR